MGGSLCYGDFNMMSGGVCVRDLRRWEVIHNEIGYWAMFVFEKGVTKFGVGHMAHIYESKH